jgi:hypothetical protein
MKYVAFCGVFLLLFAMSVLAAGIIGRGWFFWPKDESEGKPRR